MSILNLIAIMLLGAVCFSTNGSASAQPEQTAPTHKRGPVIRALLLAQGSPNMAVATVVGDKVSAPFNIGASGLSDNLFPGSKAFHLAIKDPTMPNGWRNVASIVMPESGSDFILLLEPSTDKTFITYLVNDQARGFGADATLFFNASSASIGAVMEKNKTLIRPRHVEIVPAPAVHGDVPYYQVEMYYPNNDSLKLFASSRWLHRNNGRNYVFIYQEKDTGRFDYQSFNETLAQQP